MKEASEFDFMRDIILEDAAEKRYCRICHEIASIEIDACIPCRCKGNLKYVHESCMLRWILKSGNQTCEFCRSRIKLKKLSVQVADEIGFVEGCKYLGIFLWKVFKWIISQLCTLFVLGSMFYLCGTVMILFLEWFGLDHCGNYSFSSVYLIGVVVYIVFKVVIRQIFIIGYLSLFRYRNTTIENDYEDIEFSDESVEFYELPRQEKNLATVTAISALGLFFNYRKEDTQLKIKELPAKEINEIFKTTLFEEDKERGKNITAKEILDHLSKSSSGSRGKKIISILVNTQVLSALVFLVASPMALAFLISLLVVFPIWISNLLLSILRRGYTLATQYNVCDTLMYPIKRSTELFYRYIDRYISKKNVIPSVYTIAGMTYRLKSIWKKILLLIRHLKEILSDITVIIRRNRPIQLLNWGKRIEKVHKYECKQRKLISTLFLLSPKYSLSDSLYDTIRYYFYLSSKFIIGLVIISFVLKSILVLVEWRGLKRTKLRKTVATIYAIFKAWLILNCQLEILPFSLGLVLFWLLAYALNGTSVLFCMHPVIISILYLITGGCMVFAVKRIVSRWITTIFRPGILYFCLFSRIDTPDTVARDKILISLLGVLSQGIFSFLSALAVILPYTLAKTMITRVYQGTREIILLGPDTFTEIDLIWIYFNVAVIQLTYEQIVYLFYSSVITPFVFCARRLSSILLLDSFLFDAPVTTKDLSRLRYLPTRTQIDHRPIEIQNRVNLSVTGQEKEFYYTETGEKRVIINRSKFNEVNIETGHWANALCKSSRAEFLYSPCFSIFYLPRYFVFRILAYLLILYHLFISLSTAVFLSAELLSRIGEQRLKIPFYTTPLGLRVFLSLAILSVLHRIAIGIYLVISQRRIEGLLSVTRRILIGSILLITIPLLALVFSMVFFQVFNQSIMKIVSLVPNLSTLRIFEVRELKHLIPPSILWDTMRKYSVQGPQETYRQLIKLSGQYLRLANMPYNLNVFQSITGIHEYNLANILIIFIVYKSLYTCTLYPILYLLKEIMIVFGVTLIDMILFDTFSSGIRSVLKVVLYLVPYAYRYTYSIVDRILHWSRVFMCKLLSSYYLAQLELVPSDSKNNN
ncbi:hypothetical protein NEOKW01_1431 [Nematocida sp. AWRm80]|nr:hypothetical protein NEOKW01_1431 [Nematocida sp. AWRm80]